MLYNVRVEWVKLLFQANHVPWIENEKKSKSITTTNMLFLRIILVFSDVPKCVDMRVSQLVVLELILHYYLFQEAELLEASDNLTQSNNTYLH